MNFKTKTKIGMLSALVAVSLLTLTSMTMKKSKTKAYLEITLKVKSENRTKAAGVYVKYKNPFLKQIDGAKSKELLIRTEDVQVLHGFENEAKAKAYLSTDLFKNDIVGELKPYLEGNPDVRIYSVFQD